MYSIKASDTSGSTDYGRSIRSAIRGYWSGTFDYYEFYDAMYATIRYGITRAWHEGAQECGIAPADLTIGELARLSQEITSDLSYIIGFADEIAANSKANKGKLSPLLRRAEMWTNRYVAIKSLARSYACQDMKLKWVHGPTVEPCPDCIRMTNRVYRASIWRKYGIEPRSRALNCKGYRCLCSFMITSDPVTPGRPPNLVGI